MRHRRLRRAFSIPPAYDGVYGSIDAGLSIMADGRDFESAGPALAFDSEADYENGVGAYATIGHGLGPHFRWDILEFSYRDNNAETLAGDGLGFSGWPDGLVGGKSSISLMSNLIYEFGDEDARLKPFIGAGAGMSRVHGEYSAPDAGSGAIAIDDKSWQFAYQGIAGVALRLTQNLSLDISYRYFETLEPEFDGALTTQMLVVDEMTEEEILVSTTSPLTVNQQYTTHTVFAGLRWNFGAAAAPAAAQYKECWDGSSVPVAADCPPQLAENQAANPDPMNVVVYFDYDKSNLTQEASDLIREAAARALANDVDAVVVSGNTDTSGSSAYNQMLSERRAAVVRDALIANGIPADKIRTEAYARRQAGQADT